ncbi:signal protein [Sphingomonas sp. Leaf231]|uniref:methyl-accepting chemotaxis protein n=1 Tax=Sphingomonas sp. Leaf231 TaxID=1736301 RepID=UPI0006F58AEF|nr:methyl-accepting chemotaxis protein [Sphingomonas sp. Leaf231]KQN94345.1 signal protein [Sphingomonas sp. Leaf231]
MKNLRIGKKLTLCFSILFAAILALGGLALYNQGRLSGIATELGVERRLKLEATAAMKTALSDHRIGEANHILSADAANMQLAEAVIKTQRAFIAQKVAYLEPRLNKATTRAAFERFKPLWADYLLKSDAMLAHSRLDQNEQALAGFRANKAVFHRVAVEASAMQEAQSDIMNGVVADAQALHGWSRNLMLAMIVCVGALVAIMLSALIRGIAQPLRAMSGALGQLAAGRMDVQVPVDQRADEVGDLATAMMGLRNQLATAEQAKQEQTSLIVGSIGNGLDALARGDLTARVDADLTGAFAKLKTDFNNAMAAVSTAMGAVSVSALGITNGAGDIRQASDDLSRRTEQQAASLEETAAAMDEITSTVKQTAESAGRTNMMVGETRRDAEQSGGVVQKAMDAMSGIERSSNEISEIIAVIDGIAFQTNLLALNAGVEAARAGDAGKGFAVVASEVRALAQRSADAAKDVKTRITASSEQVHLGVELVSETGKSLTRIIARIAEINELVSGIASAAEQQAVGLHQVNTAVSEMDGVTQQNAAMVEEATAAARSLSEEADTLASEVARFTLAQGSGRAPAPAASPVHKLQARAAHAGRRIAATAARPAVTHATEGNAAVAVDDWSSF